MPANPTPRQLEVLAAFRELSQNGMPPSMAELAATIGSSMRAAHDQMMALGAKGLVTWSRGCSRTWRLTAAGHLALKGIPARKYEWFQMVQCLLCRASRAGEGPCPICHPEAAVLWMVRDRAGTRSTRGGHGA